MKKIIFLLFISNSLFAQDDIVTDRPDATESALTIPFKSMQIETGITYSSEQNTENYTLPEYLIRIGISKFLELRLEHSFYKNIGINKMSNSDIFLGFKAQILKKEQFNLAFLSHVNLLGKRITEKFGFFIENFGSISGEKGLISVIDGGFSYLLKNKIQLDSKFGIDAQFFKDYFVGAGISVLFFN